MVIGMDFSFLAGRVVVVFDNSREIHSIDRLPDGHRDRKVW